MYQLRDGSALTLESTLTFQHRVPNYREVFYITTHRHKHTHTHTHLQPHSLPHIQTGGRAHRLTRGLSWDYLRTRSAAATFVFLDS